MAIAYHGDPAVKARHLESLATDLPRAPTFLRDRVAVRNGGVPLTEDRAYLATLSDASDINIYERVTGIPAELGRLANLIDANTVTKDDLDDTEIGFSVRFHQAIEVGADLSQVGTRFKKYLVEVSGYDDRLDLQYVARDILRPGDYHRTFDAVFAEAVAELNFQLGEGPEPVRNPHHAREQVDLEYRLRTYPCVAVQAVSAVMESRDLAVIATNTAKAMGEHAAKHWAIRTWIPAGRPGPGDKTSGAICPDPNSEDAIKGRDREKEYTTNRAWVGMNWLLTRLLREARPRDLAGPARKNLATAIEE